MEPDDTVCYCFHVTKRKIVNFIRITRPRRASQISECGGAGTGCGWCRPFLVHYFEQMTVHGVDWPEEELTPEEYARLRRKYLSGGKRHSVVRDELADRGVSAPGTECGEPSAGERDGG